MDYTKVIAIDFDGTLFTNKWPEIGEPVAFVIRQAKREQEAGAKLILWTNRTGELLDDAIRACESVGLHFDAVNESLPEWVEHFGTDPRKIGASEYWDDKSVTPSMLRYRDFTALRTWYLDMPSGGKSEAHILNDYLSGMKGKTESTLIVDDLT